MVNSAPNLTKREKKKQEKLKARERYRMRKENGLLQPKVEPEPVAQVNKPIDAKNGAGNERMERRKMYAAKRALALKAKNAEKQKTRLAKDRINRICKRDVVKNLANVRIKLELGKQESPEDETKMAPEAPATSDEPESKPKITAEAPTGSENMMSPESPEESKPLLSPETLDSDVTMTPESPPESEAKMTQHSEGMMAPESSEESKAKMNPHSEGMMAPESPSESNPPLSLEILESDVMMSPESPEESKLLLSPSARKSKPEMTPESPEESEPLFVPKAPESEPMVTPEAQPESKPQLSLHARESRPKMTPESPAEPEIMMAQDVQEYKPLFAKETSDFEPTKAPEAPEESVIMVTSDASESEPKSTPGARKTKPLLTPEAPDRNPPSTPGASDSVSNVTSPAESVIMMTSDEPRFEPKNTPGARESEVMIISDSPKSKPLLSPEAPKLNKRKMSSNEPESNPSLAPEAPAESQLHHLLKEVPPRKRSRMVRVAGIPVVYSSANPLPNDGDIITCQISPGVMTKLAKLQKEKMERETMRPLLQAQFTAIYQNFCVSQQNLIEAIRQNFPGVQKSLIREEIPNFFNCLIPGFLMRKRKLNSSEAEKGAILGESFVYQQCYALFKFLFDKMESGTKISQVVVDPRLCQFFSTRFPVENFEKIWRTSMEEAVTHNFDIIDTFNPINRTIVPIFSKRIPLPRFSR